MKPEAGDASDDVNDLEVTDDAFLGGRVQALQPRVGYRAGIDAVLLAAAVPAGTAGDGGGGGLRVLDAGSGVGVVGLCLAARIADATVCMVEKAPALAALARRNAERNGWAGRIGVITGDLAGPAKALTSAGLVLESFDHVLANPPFHIEGDGTAAGNRLKSGAHAMGRDALAGWARFLAAAARPGGLATIIHRAEALAPLFAALEGRFGDLRVLPIHPRSGEPASRILIQGRKASRAPLRLLPGLVLHGEGNGFLPQVQAILRDGTALDLSAGT